MENPPLPDDLARGQKNLYRRCKEQNPAQRFYATDIKFQRHLAGKQHGEHDDGGIDEADPVVDEKQRHHDREHAENFRARIETVQDGIAFYILADGDILQHTPPSFRLASAASRMRQASSTLSAFVGTSRPARLSARRSAITEGMPR